MRARETIFRLSWHESSRDYSLVSLYSRVEPVHFKDRRTHDCFPKHVVVFFDHPEPTLRSSSNKSLRHQFIRCKKRNWEWTLIWFKFTTEMVARTALGVKPKQTSAKVTCDKTSHAGQPRLTWCYRIVLVLPCLYMYVISLIGRFRELISTHSNNNNKNKDSMNIMAVIRRTICFNCCSHVGKGWSGLNGGCLFRVVLGDGRLRN